MKELIYSKSTEEGLTLIESLAAIVIFGLIVVSITPPIMLAMASRVRSFRTQQAMQLAQSEIDRVRLVTEQGTFSVTELEAQLPPVDAAANPKDVAAPNNGTDCTSTNGLSSSSVIGCQVYLDNDGDPDFVVQTFRTNTQCQGGNNVPIGFQMGIRVYTQGAINNNNTLSTVAASKGLSAASTSSNSPLVVIYTPVVRSDLNSSSEAYIDVANFSASNCP